MKNFEKFWKFWKFWYASNTRSFPKKFLGLWQMTHARHFPQIRASFTHDVRARQMRVLSPNFFWDFDKWRARVISHKKLFPQIRASFTHDARARQMRVLSRNFFWDVDKWRARVRCAEIRVFYHRPFPCYQLTNRPDIPPWPSYLTKKDIFSCPSSSIPTPCQHNPSHLAIWPSSSCNITLLILQYNPPHLWWLGTWPTYLTYLPDLPTWFLHDLPTCF